MTRHRISSAIALSLLLCGFLAQRPHRAFADSAAEVDLQRKLDAPFDLTLDKVPLQDAFATIARQAGINVQVDQAVYDVLPYGGTTAVSATFRATPLRNAIDAILSPLSLDKAISGQVVLIRPSDPLTRLGRRAEWSELQLLQKLRTSQLQELTGDWTHDLRSALGEPSIIVDITGYDGGANDRANAQIKGQLPASASDALDSYARATEKIWWVERGNILIMSPHDWIRRQLGRPIVISFANAPLEKVVAEMQRLSGIPFRPDPGLYAAFPQINLRADSATVQQTLDVLSGTSGISYDVDAEAISLHLPNSAAAASNKGDAIIGRVAVPLGEPGMTFDIFLRESDLSPELDALRKKRLAEALEQLPQKLNAPATAPAR
jgi:hypothetical protein